MFQLVAKWRSLYFGGKSHAPNKQHGDLLRSPVLHEALWPGEAPTPPRPVLWPPAAHDGGRFAACAEKPKKARNRLTLQRWDTTGGDTTKGPDTTNGGKRTFATEGSCRLHLNSQDSPGVLDITNTNRATRSAYVMRNTSVLELLAPHSPKANLESQLPTRLTSSVSLAYGWALFGLNRAGGEWGDALVLSSNVATAA